MYMFKINNHDHNNQTLHATSSTHLTADEEGPSHSQGQDLQR